jgi:hypothetical protein
MKSQFIASSVFQKLYKVLVNSLDKRICPLLAQQCQFSKMKGFIVSYPIKPGKAPADTPQAGHKLGLSVNKNEFGAVSAAHMKRACIMPPSKTAFFGAYRITGAIDVQKVSDKAAIGLSQSRPVAIH